MNLQLLLSLAAGSQLAAAVAVPAQASTQEKCAPDNPLHVNVVERRMTPPQQEAGDDPDMKQPLEMGQPTATPTLTPVATPKPFVMPPAPTDPPPPPPPTPTPTPSLTPTPSPGDPIVLPRVPAVEQPRKLNETRRARDEVTLEAKLQMPNSTDKPTDKPCPPALNRSEGLHSPPGAAHGTMPTHKSGCTKEEMHIVQVDDTLNILAKLYAVQVADILNANSNITDDFLTPGTWVKLPCKQPGTVEQSRMAVVGSEMHGQMVADATVRDEHSEMEVEPIDDTGSSYSEMVPHTDTPADGHSQMKAHVVDEPASGPMFQTHKCGPEVQITPTPVPSPEPCNNTVEPPAACNHTTILMGAGKCHNKIHTILGITNASKLMDCSMDCCRNPLCHAFSFLCNGSYTTCQLYDGCTEQLDLSCDACVDYNSYKVKRPTIPVDLSPDVTDKGGGLQTSNGIATKEVVIEPFYHDKTLPQ